MTEPNKTIGTKENPKIYTISRMEEVVYLRRQCDRFSIANGLSRRGAAELAIAVSELLTNVVKFANKGTLKLYCITSPRLGIVVEVIDDGPGFVNVSMALKDGFSCGRFLSNDAYVDKRQGLGNGLGAVLRLTDELEISNNPNGGAKVFIIKWV